MSERPPLEMLAVGHVTHDRHRDALVAGGSAWYAARVWHALGDRTRLVTAVGDDFVRDDALAGLEARVERRGRTTVFTNLYPEGGPRRQYVETQAPPVSPSLLPAAWAAPDVLFLAPVLGEVDVAAWLGATRPRLVGAGLQGWLKRALDDDDDAPRRVGQRPADVDPERFRGVAAAFLSTEDLDGDPRWVDRLAAVVPLVFLTRGAGGCDVLTPDGRHRVGVYPTAEVDPTGAGDTFAAGALDALARGASPVEAARFGAAAASVIVEGRGADTAPRLAETFARVAAVR
jgi:sugar/nucleoside kinase (ribokinase family)